MQFTWNSMCSILLFQNWLLSLVLIIFLHHQWDTLVPRIEWQNCQLNSSFKIQSNCITLKNTTLSWYREFYSSSCTKGDKTTWDTRRITISISALHNKLSWLAAGCSAPPIWLTASQARYQRAIHNCIAIHYSFNYIRSENATLHGHLLSLSNNLLFFHQLNFQFSSLNTNFKLSKREVLEMLFSLCKGGGNKTRCLVKTAFKLLRNGLLTFLSQSPTMKISPQILINFKQIQLEHYRGK